MWIDDRILARAEEKLVVDSFIPDQKTVVLGRGNNPDTEVYGEKCREDGVEILRRLGGGGTVLLSPGCVVVSVGTWVVELYQNNRYFEILNGCVIEGLSPLLPGVGLEQSGISDIVCGDKKIAGTSLYRGRQYLLYQASIIVDVNYGDLEKYLQHPSREPDYRKARTHKDFLTGLRDLSSGVTTAKVMEILGKSLPDILGKALSEEMVDPISKQIELLKQKMEQSQ